MKNTQAVFQMLDNYIEKFSIKTKRRILENEEININGRITVNEIEVRNEEKEWVRTD